ncbi:MAG: alkaline phosphatase D family protein [Planctomycetota bacterium]
MRRHLFARPLSSLAIFGLASAVLFGCGAGPQADTGVAEAVQQMRAAAEIAPLPGDEQVIQVIAFGSCANQTNPQPIWDDIADAGPDLFLFIGDNMYADLDRRFREITLQDVHDAWAGLGALAPFEAFRKKVPILATWDDHDYGLNDAGAELPFKDGAQDALLAFFHEPQDSPRWEQEGIYGSWAFGPAGKRTQIIVLDTRYHRGELNRNPLGRVSGKGPYVPHEGADAPGFLGEAQWAWLEEALQEPADLRVIASSVQVVADEHGWETWGNFPAERQRLFELIETTGAAGVVFVSGDRHLMELSVDPDLGPYPVVDFTSSGLNWWAPAGKEEETVRDANRFRVGEPFRYDNYGLIKIDWSQPDPEVTLLGVDGRGDVRIEHAVTLGELRSANND